MMILLLASTVAILFAGCSHDMSLSRPCGDQGRCPTGQSCREGVCVARDATAPPDQGADRGADLRRVDHGTDGPDLGQDLGVPDAPGPDVPALDQGLPDGPLPDLPPPDQPPHDQLPLDQPPPDQTSPDQPPSDQPPPDLPPSDLQAIDAGDICGDGKITGMEQCDGLNHGKSTCKTAGFYGGTLACHPVTCLLVTSGCHHCGNGKLDANEQCEGATLSGKTCAALEYGGGTLGCTASCKFDTAACYDVLDQTPVKVAAAAGDQTSPSVACNKAACWVVWESGGDIHGRRMDASGALDTKEVVICNAAKDQKAPRVYADGSFFLVIWQDHRSAVPHVYGAKLNSAGAVQIPSIYISNGTAGQTVPTAACDGTSCLVSWNEGGLNIHGALVPKNGVVTNTAGARLNTTSAGKTSWFSGLTAAWDGKGYTVFWKQQTNSAAWFKAMPVTPAGALGAAAEVLVQYSAKHNYFDAMIYEGPNFIAARRHHVNSWGGYMLMTPLTPKYKLLTDARVTTSTNACCPALATDGKHTLLAWTWYTSGRGSKPAYSIGLELTQNGLARSTKSAPLFSPLTTGTGAPAVAHDGTRYLAVWQDKRSSNWDILGKRVQYH